MAMNIQEALKNVGAGKVFDKGNFIKPGGAYVVEVEKLILEEKRAGTMWIAEVRVKEITQPDGAQHKVGELVTDIVNFDGKGKDSAGGNVKNFVCTLLGADPKATSEEDSIKLTSQVIHAKQPMKGARIGLEPFLTKTRAGNDFTAKRWTHIPMTGEEIAQNRAAQENPAKK